jgi:multisubunit Na+/H+ antiporter MnhB subunit
VTAGTRRRFLMMRRKRLETFRAAIWALCGAAVVLFVFFAGIGGVDPAEAWVATGVVAVHMDRERRGF